MWTFRAVGAIAGVALLAFAAGAATRSRSNDGTARITMATFFYLVLWNIAQHLRRDPDPVGQAAVLGFTMPLWSALISWAVLGERMRPRPDRRHRARRRRGDAAHGAEWPPTPRHRSDWRSGLLAGLGWAVGTLILQRGGSVGVSATVLTGWQLLITAVPTSIGAWVGRRRLVHMPTWQSVLVIGYIALVPMAVGTCWFAIVGLLPAGIAGLSAVMVPVVAMIAGAVVPGGRWSGAVAGDGLQRRRVASGAHRPGDQIIAAHARPSLTGDIVADHDHPPRLSERRRDQGAGLLAMPAQCRAGRDEPSVADRAAGQTDATRAVAHASRRPGALARPCRADADVGDLVVVGCGLSGLAGALFQRHARRPVRILMLDPLDDFAGMRGATNSSRAPGAPGRLRRLGRSTRRAVLARNEGAARRCRHRSRLRFPPRASTTPVAAL